MRHARGDLETDVWGSLGALPGVHIVDASILPSVPPTPLAFTVMANAHRIASRCAVADGLPVGGRGAKGADSVGLIPSP